MACFRDDLQMSSMSQGPSAIGESVACYITLSNLGNSTFRNLILVLEQDKYTQASSAKVDTLLPFSERQVKLTVQPQGGTTVDDVPGKSKFRLQDAATGKVLCRQSFITPSMWWYRDTITKLGEGGDWNILHFGIAGAGKSSYIQTALNVVEHGTEVERGRIRIGGSSGHVTTDLRCHKLGNIKLWDTWGLTGKNYQAAELSAMLKGKLPDGWEMYDQVGENAELIRLDAAERKYRTPQAVMVFVPHGSLDNEDEMMAVKHQIEFIRDADINPIVVLSLVDERFPELRKDAMTEPTGLTELRRHAASLFGAPLNMVTYTVNYEAETERDFNIERLCFKNIIMAVNAAKACQKARDEVEAQFGRQGSGPRWMSQMLARVRLTDGARTADAPAARAGGRGGGAAAGPTVVPAAGCGNPLNGAPGGPLCIICDDTRADVMVQPCGHMCLCSTCAPNVQRRGNQCPMCRKTIDKVQTVFY